MVNTKKKSKAYALLVEWDLEYSTIIIININNNSNNNNNNSNNK